MIETDDALHVGVRQVETVGDAMGGIGRSEAQTILNRVQDRQKRAGKMPMVGYRLGDDIRRRETVRNGRDCG
jgi:hypothetical protein